MKPRYMKPRRNFRFGMMRWFSSILLTVMCIVMLFAVAVWREWIVVNPGIVQSDIAALSGAAGEAVSGILMGAVVAPLWIMAACYGLGKKDWGDTVMALTFMFGIPAIAIIVLLLGVFWPSPAEYGNELAIIGGGGILAVYLFFMFVWIPRGIRREAEGGK